MKLAEALAQRADAQKRLKQLGERIKSNAWFQEGDSPAEDVRALIAETDRVADDLERLIRSINRTNAVTELEPGVTLQTRSPAVMCWRSVARWPRTRPTRLRPRIFATPGLRSGTSPNWTPRSFGDEPMHPRRSTASSMYACRH